MEVTKACIVAFMKARNSWHSLKWGPRTGTAGPGTQDPRNQTPETKDPGPGTQDKELRTKDPRLRTGDSGTQKLGTLGFWMFLLNFKIKCWKVRNRLQVNVIMQRTLSQNYFSHIFLELRFISEIFRKIMGTVVFCLKIIQVYLDHLLFNLPKAAWERRGGGTFFLNLSN